MSLQLSVGRLSTTKFPDASRKIVLHIAVATLVLMYVFSLLGPIGKFAVWLFLASVWMALFILLLRVDAMTVFLQLLIDMALAVVTIFALLFAAAFTLNLIAFSRRLCRSLRCCK